MPNWNTTDYTLFGYKKNIKRLYTDLKKTVDIDRTKESKPFTFLGNSYWLGYIKKSLFPEVEEELPARGELSYIEEEIEDHDNDMASLKLTTETAWVACSELMDKIAEKYDLQIFYYSEEPGCGIFETNDTEGQFYSFRYMVDSEKGGIEYYDTFDQVAESIADMTGIWLNNISEADDNDKLSAFNNDDTFLIINEISVV
ncbi:DUF1281 family ferredoxin-like fold protein [Phocaeicola vulgatus]|uniref:DUF1281 family ferredoxin-like fold protein n=1 Tax=Phocaeicola vulgatus TaxID=821 RepID=UPI001F2AFB23|nr:hypothetical protein [Phocaeicola vulgatus]MCG0155292.1 hypothetical protein [Phocaeicola vulgatus]MCG0329228.1 hypothetical protein [Phocaeicola vulgatus]MCG0333113.1 hypothetical protein [Phocaeicola vulgatus]